MDSNDMSLEALQAQIDMSMSFAQGLVSSWVKPRGSGTSRKKLDLENELLEAARRRPRLGVGAAASETGPAPRDTARLKTQLAGKKRVRSQDELEIPANALDDDDEGESRAGAIKKKAKLDPFDKSKKKKNTAAIPPTPVQKAPSASDQATGAGSSSAKPPSTQPERPVTLSPLSKKKNGKRLDEHTASAPVFNGQANSVGIVSGRASHVASAPRCAMDKGTVNVAGEHVDELSTPSSHQSESSRSSNNVTKLASAPSIRCREPPSSSKHVTNLLEKSLLNLQEISDDSGSEDEAANTTPSSPKKRRRRRKKKKTALAIDNPAPSTPSSAIKLLIS